MIKFNSMMEGFQEVPGEVALLVNITNCMNNCDECHSQELKTDSGSKLLTCALDFGLTTGPYTCVCLMGEGNDKEAFIEILLDIRRRGLKVAVYCGRDIDVADWCQEYGFVPDYLKVGSYKKDLGGLNNSTTNQRLYHCSNSFEDITWKFWKHLR